MANAKRWLILAIVSSALFLIVIDMTVLYTALPTLTRELSANASEKLWIVNAYPLVMAGLLPSMGVLGDRLGHKKLFNLGLAVFGVASLIAAFSPVPALLIAARVLLAVGAAMMMPATLSIIRLTFTDEKERMLAIGIWASVSSGGAGLGPLVGGFLLEHFYWGSVFLINIPVVIVALIASMLIVPHTKAAARRKWDFASSALVMLGLAGVLYAVKEIAKPNGSIAIAVPTAVVGIIALIVFAKRQKKSSAPLIDFSLFRNKRFGAGAITALLSSFALIGLEYVLTQRLQLVMELSPLQAGLLILPLPIAAFLAGPLMGSLLHRMELIKVLLLSLLLAGSGMAAYLLLFDSGRIWQVVCMIVIGFGLGAGMSSASSAIMNQAPAEKAGMAASIEEVSFELGGAVGIAVLGSLASFAYTASLSLPESLRGVQGATDSLDGALGAAESLPQASGELLVQLAKEAFEQSFSAVLASGAVVLIGAALVLMRIGRKASASAKNAHS